MMAGVKRFLHTVLDHGLVDQRQQLLRLWLGGRQKTGAKSRGGEHGFTHFGRHPYQFPSTGMRRATFAPGRASPWGPRQFVFFLTLCYLYASQVKQDMAYVIAEPCIGTKDTACVDACPVDCIHPKKDEPNFAEAEMLYIDPVECIDCGACVPVCPVSAIFALDDLPEKWTSFTPKNAAYYNR
jgi:NAD-dependent dihydropyrimidine dehydrogenase PreA subunit